MIYTIQKRKFLNQHGAKIEWPKKSFNYKWCKIIGQSRIRKTKGIRKKNQINSHLKKTSTHIHTNTQVHFVC